MNVLIIDDDIVDRETVKRILKKSGEACDVVETETVDQGLAAIEQQFFDVILLDYSMPQRNGIELLLEIKNDASVSGTAVIMISSSDEEKLALECIRAGAQDFLTKTDVSTFRLNRAIITARTRAELELELSTSYKKTKDLAEHDNLTGLANRYVFDESLKHDIANNQRANHHIALLLLDLDHFKFVNDNYGHDVGDQLLIAVTNRINDCLRGHELFARLGGDEFAITLTNLTSVLNTNSVTSRIINAFKTPFKIGELSIQSGVSIGIAIYPDDSSNAKELFKYADIAMYRAKKMGRNQFSFFEVEMQKQFLSLYQMENQLRLAVERKEFILAYQPIINNVTQKISGVEALVRWQNGDQLIPPDQFIPVAEKSRLIIPIGKTIICNALAQLSHWNKIRSEPINLAINLSPVQLTDPELVSYIGHYMKEYNLAAELVCFELTETALLVDLERTEVSIQGIKDLGCQIALDDFGTGFSSLSHLLDYPIDIVKIDKSLMPSFSSAAKAEHILVGLVAMIKSLKLKSTAEGIESEKDLDLCSNLQIDKLQGYYFDKPLSVRQLEEKYIAN